MSNDTEHLAKKQTKKTHKTTPKEQQQWDKDF